MAKLGDKAVGSIIKIKVNGTATDFIVVHQGLPSSMYDSSCNGTWLLMKNSYDKRVTDNTDDYKNSNIHSYLNSTFLNLFDSNIKAAIKQVKIPYVNGASSNDSVASGSSGLSTKIFALSGREVGATKEIETGETSPIDGAKLSYFLNGNSESANSKRICFPIGEDYSVYWLLRSPSTEGPWVVWTTGECTFYAYNGMSSYVRPAFILPNNLTVKSDGTVDGSTNTPPTISGSNSSGSNLGEKSAPFNFTYTVRDADNNTVTVKEYLDNVLQRSYTASLGATNTFQATSNAGTFQKILNGSHTIKVIATDSAGASSSAYTVTFNKQVRTAVITLSSPLPADDVIKAAVVTVTGNIPSDATLEVLVTNNALDASPVWENMTQDYLKKINHLFSNKTAANGFAFNFKVTVTRGVSGTQGYISSIGGAFE